MGVHVCDYVAKNKRPKNLVHDLVQNLVCSWITNLEIWMQIGWSIWYTVLYPNITTQKIPAQDLGGDLM